ncbi:MAG: hypothetical protein AAGB04_22510 [Pseudomonadota bacterium]
MPHTKVRRFDWTFSGRKSELICMLGVFKDEFTHAISSNGSPILKTCQPQADNMMTSKQLVGSICAVSFLMVALPSFGTLAQTGKAKHAYGKKADRILADKLWRSLLASRMVGRNRLNVHAIEGKQPHGAVQQIYAAKVEVNGRIGRAIVKANHRKKGATVQSVYDTPNKFLSGYTVMFENEAGYDPDNRNWFWVHYNVAGKVNRAANGLAVAGRVGKFSNYGCISCHRKIGGQDFEALTSR